GADDARQWRLGRWQPGGDVVTVSSPRRKKVRVRGSKGRSLSSRLWLERQFNDPYVARANREGMPSPPGYKLIEIDDKARFLKKGARVIDLGAAPGGWSQVAAQRVGAPGQGTVIAVDVLSMETIPGVNFVRLDFLNDATPDKLKEIMGGPAAVVLSDIKTNATCHARTKHFNDMTLSAMPADFAVRLLSP